MSGSHSRRKGRNGQTTAQRLLRDRDYQVDPITSGVKREDLIATAPTGKKYAVEVKDHKLIDLDKFIKQARDQGKVRGLDWMLMVHIPGTRDWLVRVKGGRYNIWRGKDGQ